MKLLYKGREIEHKGQWPVLILNHQRYAVVGRDFEVLTRGDGLEITDGGFEVVNKCDCCGRFDTQRHVARSFEEAEQLGMIARIMEQ